mmetsp:Transcript_1602/g.4854  ORF Transcript_1602/g.4854 Transcript_1602/m.4854 type:complete len:200 (-) Transcript_1602:231-830(-)
MLWMPQEYREHGLLWWRSQLLHAVWRPRRHVREYVEGQKKKLSWPDEESVCAIHVRRGDKGGGGRAGRLVVDMPVYIEEMTDMSTRFSISNVYIAGDDAETVATMVAAAKDRGLRAMFDSDEARTCTDNSAMMLLSHKVNITRYALDAITNTELLASADLFIGTFGSHLSRLAYELAFARRGGFAHPPVTLDVLWFVNP